MMLQCYPCYPCGNPDVGMQYAANFGSSIPTVPQYSQWQEANVTGVRTNPALQQSTNTEPPHLDNMQYSGEHLPPPLSYSQHEAVWRVNRTTPKSRGERCAAQYFSTATSPSTVVVWELEGGVKAATSRKVETRARCAEYKAILSRWHSVIMALMRNKQTQSRFGTLPPCRNYMEIRDLLRRGSASSITQLAPSGVSQEEIVLSQWSYECLTWWMAAEGQKRRLMDASNSCLTDHSTKTADHEPPNSSSFCLDGLDVVDIPNTFRALKGSPVRTTKGKEPKNDIPSDLRFTIANQFRN